MILNHDFTLHVHTFIWVTIWYKYHGYIGVLASLVQKFKHLYKTITFFLKDVLSNIPLIYVDLNIKLFTNVLTLDGTSKHVAHVRRNIDLFL